MSFQFPERKIPPSTSPSGNTYPALLVMLETAEIPTAVDSDTRDRAARRITRNVLDNFWLDIEDTSSAPFLQLMDRAGYNECARKNRERIARECNSDNRLLFRKVS